MEPRRVGPADFQLPDSLPECRETAARLGIEVIGEITLRAECGVHAPIEVLAGLAITPNDLVGHAGAQRSSDFVAEVSVIIGERYP